MKRQIFILLTTLCVFNAYAATRTANTTTGATPLQWSLASSWENNLKPVAGDDVIIPSAAKILLDEPSLTVNSIMVMGQLIVDNTKDISIRTKYVMVMGTTALFQWGTAAAPYLRNGVLTLVGTNPAELIPGHTHTSKSLMAMDGAKLIIHGKPKKSWTQLAQTALKNSTQLVLTEPVTDWSINDSLVVASTELPDHTLDALGVMTIKQPFVYQNEVVRITAINGSTVTVSPALKYQHWGQTEAFANGKGNTWTLDERAEVGLLTRNIKIQGDENSDALQFGARIMVMKDPGTTAESKISDVELKNAGTAGVQGAYPFHWHLCKSVTGQYIKNTSIHNSYNRAVTVHGTQNATVQNNVCFNIKGHAIFLEDAVETGTLIDNNLVLSVFKPAAAKALLDTDDMNNIDNRAAGPAGIWITNPNNTVTNNHVSGAGSGIWYALPQSPSGASYLEPVSPRTISIKTFDNNTTHSCYVGVTFDYSSNVDPATGAITGVETAHYDPSVKSYITKIQSFKNARGIWFRGGNNVEFSNFVLADNLGNGAFVPTFKTKFKDGCIIGHSQNNVSTTFSTYGSAFYDGSQDIENCHFQNFDGYNQSILNIFGGANKTLYNTLNGVTYNNCNIYNPFGTAEASPNNSFAFDIDGSLTGTPNSMICLNHPFYLDAGNFTPLTEATGWGMKTPLKFGQIRIERDASHLNNDLLYYDRPTSNGGMHDTGVPASPYAQASMAVNTTRIHNIRYCDAIPVTNKLQLYSSYQVGDVVRIVIQGSPEQLVVSSGATTVSSLGTLATATTNAAFWEATKKELHLKLVATAGATYNASSSWVTFSPVSGTRLTASVNGIKSRPYDGAARKTGTVIEAEDFDLGGQNVAYYSASRYTATDPVTGQPIYLLSSTDYNHADEVRIGEMVKLKKVFSGTSPVTATDYTKANEYLKYTIDVQADGFYDIQLQMGAQNASNQLQILQNDTLLRTEIIPRLGTSTEIKPYTISGIPLKKGVRVLTLKMLTNLMTFDNFKVQYSTTLALSNGGKKDSTDIEIDDKTLSVYPNPATDMVNIKFKTWKSRTIMVYNQFNKIVFSKKVLASELAIPTKDIGGAGVYFVVINDEIHKLVIVK
jgi:G8 domain/Secretion system C-terminal sorting domain